MSTVHTYKNISDCNVEYIKMMKTFQKDLLVHLKIMMKGVYNSNYYYSFEPDDMDETYFYVNAPNKRIFILTDLLIRMLDMDHSVYFIIQVFIERTNRQESGQFKMNDFLDYMEKSNSINRFKTMKSVIKNYKIHLLYMQEYDSFTGNMNEYYPHVWDPKYVLMLYKDFDVI